MWQQNEDYVGFFCHVTTDHVCDAILLICIEYYDFM